LASQRVPLHRRAGTNFLSIGRVRQRRLMAEKNASGDEADCGRAWRIGHPPTSDHSPQWSWG
jgi:hypothetical protein